MEAIMNNFNFKWFQAMKEEGITARDFAKITGDSEALISLFLNGHRKIDPVRQIKYAKLLRRKPEELFN